METQMQTKPVRCFEGNAQPHEPFWNIKNTADGVEIEFDGTISEYSWFDDDITPAKFKKALYDAGNGGPVRMRINSYGGDVIAASKIYSIIREYPGEVTTQIDGIAASAATVVALAGDKVQMKNTGYFMIHDPLFVVFLAALNIEDLRRMGDSLESVKEGIINAYADKTGLSRDRLSKLMTEETWMDANKAHDLGFVDEVIGKESKLNLPANSAIVNNMQFVHVPQAVLEAIQPVDEVDQPLEPETSEPAITEDQQREAQNLRDQVTAILRKEN